MEKETRHQEHGAIQSQDRTEIGPDETDPPKKPTLGHNIIGTVKVLAIAALVIGLLWALDLWVRR